MALQWWSVKGVPRLSPSVSWVGSSPPATLIAHLFAYSHTSIAALVTLQLGLLDYIDIV